MGTILGVLAATSVVVWHLGASEHTCVRLVNPCDSGFSNQKGARLYV